MKKSGFTQEQIIGFFRQAEAGIPIKQVCRSAGFSDATFYKWRAKFGGMQASEAQRLRELQADNAKLKKLLAEAHSGYARAQQRSGGKALAPQVKREAIGQMVDQHHLSERRACRLVGLSRDCYRHRPALDAVTQALSARIVELAHERRRFG